MSQGTGIGCLNLVYFDEVAEFPIEYHRLGKWLGVAHRVGLALCHYILNEHAHVVLRSTVQPICKDGFEIISIKEQTKNLDCLMHEQIGEADLEAIPVELQDDYEMFNPMEPAACEPAIDIIGDENYDTLLYAKVMLPLDGILMET